MQWFTKNLPYKIIALFLATLFWYIVQSEEVLEINRKVQVTISVPEGFIVKDGPVRMKDVTLSGSRALLGDFPVKPIEANIQIKDKRAAKVRVRFDKEFIPHWNHRIKLIVHDAYIPVEIDERLTRTVPVKELIQGVPAEGVLLEKTFIEPSKVVVSGPRSEVKKIRHIFTEPIDINGLSASAEYDIPVQPIEYAQISSEHVRIIFQISEKKINRRFTQVPVELEGGSPNHDFHLKPNTVGVLLQAPVSVLERIQEGHELRARVEVSGLSMGRHEVKILVKAPHLAHVIEITPEYAVLEIVDHKEVE